MTAGRVRRRLKELGAFGAVGGFAFVIDVGLFQLFYAHMDIGAVTAKTMATLVSMVVAFLGHRNWAFAHRDRTTVRRSFSRFSLINAGTLAIGAAIVWFVRYPLDQESVLVIQIANVGSIGLNSVLRYLAYRRWVFPALAGATTGAGAPHHAAGAAPSPTPAPAGFPPEQAHAGDDALPPVTRGAV